MSQNSLKEAVTYYSDSDLLLIWENTKETLKKVKENEMIYRKEVVRRFFNCNGEGIYRIPLTDGRKLKLHIKLNYSVKSDDDNFQKNYDLLAEKVGAENIDKIIVWKAEVGVRQYKQLEGEAKIAAEKLIVTTEAAPMLSFETEE